MCIRDSHYTISPSETPAHSADHTPFLISQVIKDLYEIREFTFADSRYPYKAPPYLEIFYEWPAQFLRTNPNGQLFSSNLHTLLFSRSQRPWSMVLLLAVPDYLIPLNQIISTSICVHFHQNSTLIRSAYFDRNPTQFRRGNLVKNLVEVWSKIFLATCSLKIDIEIRSKKFLATCSFKIDVEIGSNSGQNPSRATS